MSIPWRLPIPAALKCCPEAEYQEVAG